ncbi:neuroligin-4, X-linked isoform X2 [Leptinotarsa decemlineata]|uniref:neuroligin-4, X-linked isoform X2 n=1 Tax=Leptinotarsa decemlineata TaxID=7539 RepID=UPI003D30AA39
MRISDTTRVLRNVNTLTTIFCVMWIIIIIISPEVSEAGVSFLVHKYSTRIVRTKYGPLRGIMIHIHPSVEAFLGVPYATPPVGSLRYMPPVTPSIWKTTRLADRFSDVCPQNLPDISNRSEALLEFPKNRLLYLEKILPLLANQSEDCLYLNLYVPRTANGGEEPNPLPCLVFVHGESYEWNSGNIYDGSILASTGKIIVVTINFRLGVLGFLKTGSKGSAQGNFGLMDLIAGLHWLRENLSAFGGDPQRITLVGHGTGAALVNFVAVSPVAKELLHRVILLSGSSLSPWALQKEPLSVKRSVAEHTGCHGDLHEDDLAPCLRLKPLNLLLNVKLETPRFLTGFAPFTDGTILVNPTSAPSTSSSSTIATSAGFEMADFPERDLLFSLTSTESYLDLNAQDLEFGFNETKRDRILRTYVRNSYSYHLNEIFSTLKNEYTDWEKPSQNPLNVRDTTLEVLSDGHTASPLLRIGYLHTMGGGKSFFLHFQHHGGDRDLPMRLGSVRGDEIPYIFGLPLSGSGTYNHNDVYISKTLINYISNFVVNGDPNGAVSNNSQIGVRVSQIEKEREVSLPFWDTYDVINQFYLEIGSRAVKKDHYRGHKMSLWLNLIPQLHRPGEGDEISMRHHHFQEEDERYYDGPVRPQYKEKPHFVHVVALPPPEPSTISSLSGNILPVPLPPKSDTALQATTTECPPDNTIVLPSLNKNPNNLLRKLASSHFQSYTTALTVTIGVGCFLLLLNIIIFAGIYHQRDRGKSEQKQKEEQEKAGSCSSSSMDCYEKGLSSDETPIFSYEKSCRVTFDHQKCEKPHSCNNRIQTGSEITEIPLQQFKSSPPPAKRTNDSQTHPPDVTNSTKTCNSTTPSSAPRIPQCEERTNQIGILRPAGMPPTPGTVKKRVQIHEISV